MWTHGSSVQRLYGQILGETQEIITQRQGRIKYLCSRRPCPGSPKPGERRDDTKAARTAGSYYEAVGGFEEGFLRWAREKAVSVPQLKPIVDALDSLYDTPRTGPVDMSVFETTTA